MEWYDAPYNYEIRDGKAVVIITPINLILKARGCSNCSGICTASDISTGFYSATSNQSVMFIYEIDDILTVSGASENRYNISLDKIVPLSQKDNNYGAKIKHSQTACLKVDYVGLRVNYYLMGSVGRVLNSMSVSPVSLPKYSSFYAVGDIACIEGPCGNINAYMQYSYSASGPWYNVSTSGSGVPIYTQYPNPHPCGPMNHGDQCIPSWTVQTQKAGNYYVRMLSDSNMSLDNSTKPVLVSVNPGAISLYGSINPSIINLSGSALLTGYLNCGTAPCGNVKLALKYRAGSSGAFVSIGSSGNLSTTNPNPQDCGSLNAGDVCTKTWYVYGNVPNDYQLMILAYSNDADVLNRTYTLNLKVNPAQTVGELQVANNGASPGIVQVSQNSTLAGTVSCSREYCGNVVVYARANGIKITANDLATAGNPRVCYDMDDGDSCSISWSIRGNAAGYYPLDILADSDQGNVVNKTSTITYLQVVNPVGNLFFPFEPAFGPGTMEISGTATLHAVADCNTNYCGRLTALVKYNSLNLSVSGDLTTQDQNPQSCQAYPCGFSWNIRGVNSGSYDVTLTVKSNESSPALFRSYSLVVTDPNKPSLSISLGSLQDKYELGKPFPLTASVACSNGNCGEVKVYAKYKKNEMDAWSHLDTSTPIFTAGNPKVISLSSDGTQAVQWTLNSSMTGTYILGVSADATDSNVIDSGTASKGIEVFMGSDVSLEIQSPARGGTYARGDELTVRAAVTESGYPMTGSYVTASSEGLFSAVQLDDLGNGIYSKTIRIGNSISRGSYILNVYVRKDPQVFTEITNVYVNPELEVTVETGRYQYEILERVRIQGQTLKNGKPVQASVKLKLACPSRSFKEIVLDTDSSGNFLHEYLISMATPTEVCRFELNTEDLSKNYNLTSREVRIVSSENEVYGVEFLSPAAGGRFKKGDSLKIRAGVSYGGEPLAGAEVRCISPLLEESIILADKGNGVYESDYSIPKESPADLWVLTCVAETDDGYFGRKSVDVYVTRLELILQRISPVQNIFQPGDVANIRLKLAYPDSKPFLNATVYLKTGSETIRMNETGDGVYEGEYEVRSQGVFSFDVYAEDSFGNSGSFPGEIVLTAGFTPLSLYWLILPFVVVVLILAGVVWKRGRKEIIIKEETSKPRVDRKTELRNQIAELDRKISDIEKAKDEVEDEYYQRKIDEKTFNRMIQNYEQDRIRLNVERESLKKELAGL